jgi:hypothetical protein
LKQGLTAWKAFREPFAKRRSCPETIPEVSICRLVPASSKSYSL